MTAVMAIKFDANDPLSALGIGEPIAFDAPPGWVKVRPVAGSINHHDLWSLRGVGLLADQLPIVLGTDAVAITETGDRVLVYPIVIESSNYELGAAGVSLLSEKFPGTFADELFVPEANLIPLPPEISDEEAGCLSTAWLTAYRMLTTQANLQEGQTVLIQGAGGGVSNAAIVLARALGATVWVTSRSPEKRARALQIGATAVFEPNVRLPGFADVVIETVGEATWAHSLKAVKTGGVIVVSGATSGSEPSADLRRVFRRQIRIQGSSMGTPFEMSELVQLLIRTGARPVVAAIYPREAAREAFARFLSGDFFGKIVLTAD
jgi:NADPH:quinone reductase-like Zn-dependent oxidoreductase